MSNKKLNSIEWLFDQMSNYAAGAVTELNPQEMLEKAKEMHKEEHDKTSEVWFNEGTNVHNGRKYQNFEQYYKDTFKECKD